MDTHTCKHTQTFNWNQLKYHMIGASLLTVPCWHVTVSQFGGEQKFLSKTLFWDVLFGISSVVPKWSNSFSRVGHLVFPFGQWSTIEALSNTLSLECNLRQTINFKIFLGGDIPPDPLSMSYLWQLSFLRQLASNTVSSKYIYAKMQVLKLFWYIHPCPSQPRNYIIFLCQCQFEIINTVNLYIYG